MKKKLAVLLTFALVIGLLLAGKSTTYKTYAKEAQMQLVIPESIQKENDFTIKVTLDSDVDLYSIDAYISYDAEKMEFIPTTDQVTGAAGILEIKDVYAEETKKAEYEITFRALDTGSTEIALTDVFLIDYADMDYIEVVPSAKQFEIGINKKIENDARLSDMLVAPGELTEEFSPDKIEYEMYVDSDVEMVGISAIPMDESSVVGLEMPEKLEQGENLIVVTVTALSGNVNTYTIKVYRGTDHSEITKEVPNEISGE
ncbi:MAG: cadherin-like beta sandwich domain-containing protein [Lachnospiraceae bacterium]